MKANRVLMQRRVAGGALALASVALIALAALLASAPAPMRGASADQMTALTVIITSEPIAPGHTGIFRFRLSNSSGADRTFSLSTIAPDGVSSFFLNGTQITVPNGSATEFSLHIALSQGVEGTILTPTLYATSSNPSVLQLSTVFPITVGSPNIQATEAPFPYAVLEVASSPLAIMPGSIGNFQFRIRYSGFEGSHSFALTTMSTGNVTFTFPQGQEVVVADGSSVEFTVSVLVAQSMVPGTSYTQMLIAHSSDGPAIQRSTLFNVLIGGTPPTPTYTPAAVLSLPFIGRPGPGATLTPTRTPPAGPPDVSIFDVLCRDPQYPDDSEYIELRNDGTAAVNLTGWSISNASRSGISYTFPAYTLDHGPDVYVTIWSGIGTDRPDFAEFYWNRSDPIWFVGDQAELRDGQGRLVDTYSVPAANCP